MARKRTTAPVEEAKKPPASPEMTRFRVSDEAAALTQLCHGEQVFPVVNGVVELPSGEDWYKYLVGSMLEAER